MQHEKSVDSLHTIEKEADYAHLIFNFGNFADEDVSLNSSTSK